MFILLGEVAVVIVLEKQRKSGDGVTDQHIFVKKGDCCSICVSNQQTALFLKQDWSSPNLDKIVIKTQSHGVS